MDQPVRRIGVFTSGGDAPGMNAAIRSVVRTCLHMGIECIGVRRGYHGLINGDFVPLTFESVSGLSRRGGTMLYSARSEDFKAKLGQEKAAATCKLLGLDALVGIGGDGTFRGLLCLAQQGLSVIGIPGTIDNDIACSTYTIGYDTACNTAVECIDKLRDTMQSHERCSVVEVMGHHAGHLALNVGVACGATAVLVPERTPDYEQDVIEPIRRAVWAGVPISWSSWRKAWTAPITWRRRSRTPPLWIPGSPCWGMCSGAGRPPPATGPPPPIWVMRQSAFWRRERPAGWSPCRATPMSIMISPKPLRCRRGWMSRRIPSCAP